MVSLGTLWLPILVSAVVVFVASSLVWMVLPHHRNDWEKLPGEDDILSAFRRTGLHRGQYRFPFVNPRDRSAETQRRIAENPMGTMVVWPPGPMNMGKQLGGWFVYLLVVSFWVAYLCSLALPHGVSYRSAFRFAGTASMLTYALAPVPSSVWWGRPWSTTLKEVADGVAYGLLTAAVFGWLWPR